METVKSIGRASTTATTMRVIRHLRRRNCEVITMADIKLFNINGKVLAAAL